MSPTSAALAAQQPSPSAKAFAIPVDTLSIALSVAGDPSRPALLLLHGWPHSRALFHGVLDELSGDFFVLAPDLPGIGDSRGAPAASDKATLAHILLTAAERAGAKDIIVAGLDIGGMTAFATARDHGKRIAGAVVMNTVIPGVEPWKQLISDPQVWHFEGCAGGAGRSKSLFSVTSTFVATAGMSRDFFSTTVTLAAGVVISKSFSSTILMGAACTGIERRISFGAYFWKASLMYRGIIVLFRARKPSKPWSMM